MEVETEANENNENNFIDGNIEVLMESSSSSSSSSEDEVSSSSSSDEELLWILLQYGADRHPRVTVDDYVGITVPQYDEQTFVSHFRVRRDTHRHITEGFSHSQYYGLQNEGGRNQIEAQRQTLLYLWYVGHETSCYRDVADRFDVTLSTMFEIIERVGTYLVSIGETVIKWPTEQEMQEGAEALRVNKGFPGVAGMTDGTQIRTDKPVKNGDGTINRHGYPALQLQITCNYERKIIDAFTGYSGATHDARVFRNSSVPQKPLYGFQLLGDSAYKLTSAMLVPYRNRANLSAIQKNFNKKHSQCRIVVEHAIGCLKQRFKILKYLKLRLKRRQITTIIACCVLHNLSNLGDLELINEMPPVPEEVEEDFQDDPLEQPAAEGIALRDAIANALPR